MKLHPLALGCAFVVLSSVYCNHVVGGTTTFVAPPNPDGMGCNDDVECASDSCVGGICVAPANGLVEIDGDCSGGEACVAIASCEEGLCVANSSACAGAGKACAVAEDCCDGYCNGQSCGFTSGTGFGGGTGAGGGGTGGTGGNCVMDGFFCLENSECCGGACNTAMNMCGCGMLGDSCSVDGDCCDQSCDQDSFTCG